MNDKQNIAWISDETGGITVGYGPFTAAEVPPEDGAAFYINDFGLTDSAPWKIPARLAKESCAVAGIPPSISWENIDAAPFSEIFQQANAHIHAGDFEKTVPVVTETGTITAGDTGWFPEASRDTGGELVSYGFRENGCGFAGATPERLFTLTGGSLHTMALAGTARSEDAGVFAVDEKEIREHEYVACTLVSKLTHLGDVIRHPRKILDLGSLVHFLTRIELHPRQTLSAQDLIRLLHPTPALGPLPRTEENLAILIDWRRRLGCPETFGSPFGFWDRGRMDAIVAIRGIWWNGPAVALPAGCGLIEASRLVNEWRELRLKRDAVKRFFRIV